MHTKFYLEKLKEKDHLGDLRTDGQGERMKLTEVNLAFLW
jgi:hypothetical protein